jgi:hypothetical protein
VIDRLRSALAPESPLRARTAGLESALVKIGLPAWFIAIDLLWVVRPVVLGVDARHYQRASSTWLAGGDPWSVFELGFPYAAGPHTLLLYVPTSRLPLELSTALWLAIGAAASIWVVRRLGLPLWWVLFPPLAHAIWNANPQTLMLALLVLGSGLAGRASAGIAGGLAAIAKLYALLPLAFHPRRLVVAAIVLLVTLPFVPWQLYLDHGFGVGSHLGTAWNGSAWRVPILIPPTLLALWVLRRQGAEWFSVPAVFPAIQFYYVSTALPAVVGRPLVAAAIAAPVPLVVPFIVILLALASMKVRQTAHGPDAIPVSS